MPNNPIVHKVPGSFDGAPWQPSKQGYLFKLVVPKEYHSRIKALTGQEDRYAVVAICFCDSKEEVKNYLAEETEEVRAIPTGEEPKLKDAMTAIELGELFMVEDRTIRLWSKAGLIEKVGRDQYLAFSAIQNRLRALNERAEGRTMDEAKKETLEGKRLKRLREERDFLIDLGQLLNAEETIKEWEKHNQAVASQFHLFRTLIPRLKGLEEYEMEEIVDQFTRECLTTLAPLDVTRISKTTGKQTIKAKNKTNRQSMGRKKSSSRRK